MFNYKPIYYDPEKEERKRMFGAVDGSRDAVDKDGNKVYVPGSYIQGSMRDGAYRQSRSHNNKAQNIIGLIGLILIAVVLIFIAKFYTLL